jgi:predicted  nucleic acid-binding Zn-ribbon protein
MIEQLQTLLILQDLDILIKEMQDKKVQAQEKKLGFSLGNLEKLEKAREELSGKIDKEILKHYEKLMQRYNRAVVPVRDGTCFGCFIKQAAYLHFRESDDVLICEHCSRFQFRIS